MGRPRTPIGTYGEIEYTTISVTRVRARTRVRDYDGKIRRVEASAATRIAAEHRLKEKLAARLDYSAGSFDLTRDSTFRQLVDVWLADLDLEDGLAASTRELYERNMTKIVLPAFESYTLREVTVAKVERFLKSLQATKSYSSAKQARTVLNLALGLATRYEAIAKNPVRDTKRMKKPASQAVALSADKVEAIRRAVRSWRRGPGLPGPPPDGQLEDIIEVMLGTSARIGEVLAIRRCDVDVTSTPPTVRICGTIVCPKGKPPYRQPFPKTEKSNRTAAVPSFTTAAVRRRLSKAPVEDTEHLLFFTRNGTPFTPNNIRRRLRAVLEEVGITGVTPHSFRRTVATVVERAADADLAADLLGHTSSEITKKYYIEPDQTVDPRTAEILEELAPRRSEENEEDEEEHE